MKLLILWVRGGKYPVDWLPSLLRTLAPFLFVETLLKFEFTVP